MKNLLKSWSNRVSHTAYVSSLAKQSVEQVAEFLDASSKMCSGIILWTNVEKKNVCGLEW